MHREKRRETDSGGPQAPEAIGEGVEEGQGSVQGHAEEVKAGSTKGLSREHRGTIYISHSSFLICRSHHFVVMLRTLTAD